MIVHTGMYKHRTIYHKFSDLQLDILWSKNMSLHLNCA